MRQEAASLLYEEEECSIVNSSTFSKSFNLEPWLLWLSVKLSVIHAKKI